MRTFLCLPIQEETRRRIASTANKLRKNIDTRLSWVKQDNYHVTIRFLGEIDPMLTLELKDACQAATSHIPSFTIPIDKVGAFPTVERPRVLWIGGNPPDPFFDLLSGLDSRLSKLGFNRARRETMAHITLARIKGRMNTPLSQIVGKIDNPRCIMHANSLVLMESQLSRQGAIYSPLFSLPLAKSAADTKGKA